MSFARFSRDWRCAGLAALCLAGSFCAVTARAQSLSPEVSRGLAWLQSQVQADGTLANEANSVATALQNRSEAGQALAALATFPPKLADAIAADADLNTEYVARQAIALIAAGRDASAQIALLLLRSNADRGFGGGPGFASNPLHTAWAVLALARAGQAEGSAARDARAYLMTSLQSDGGVSAPDDESRVEYSAVTLAALRTTGDGSTATAVRTLVGWLLQRQGADGGWQGDTYLTAFSVLSVAPSVSDTAVRSAASGFLLARQGAAGSWQDDPFLTAVALRALSIGAASPSAATLVGEVLDQGTNLPLAGASVALSGPATGSAVTDTSGRFRIVNLTAGNYTYQVARLGYAGASGSFALNSGQTLDAGRIVLSQIATTGIVRGRVTAATGGAPLAGVAISVTGSATLGATTDPSGSFEFPSVAPGAIVIAASLTGFQIATGSAIVVGGQTLVFSPALYGTNDSTPTTGRFFGRVVSASTKAALPGAAVVLNGTAAGTSAADGSFDFTLNPASYLATYSLANFGTVTQSFVLAAGAVVDAGNIPLPPLRTSTSITGRVTDSGGPPLSGATVQLLGGASAATAADGSYALNNLTGTNFDLRVSATGYASQLVTLLVSQPTEVVQNFSLTAGNFSLAIGNMEATPASAGANVEVSVSTSISNTGTSPASAVVMMQIVDSDGAGGTPGAVIGAGTVLDSGGAPLGELVLDGGASRAVRAVWNTARFPAGRYQLVLRLVVPSSITAATPQGTLLGEKPTTVSVIAQTHFGGSVTANPPVLRAGTNTPVQLSALIQNNGNALLPAQSYTLKVVNTQTNAVANSQVAIGRTLAVSELDTLSFSDWTPPAGGDFRVELTSPNAAEGKITTSLFVGDSGSAKYITNKLVVPAGTQTVRANLKVTGQDAANGTISDPLAAPIRQAIQKAVTFADSFGASHYVNDLKCFACHVETQSVLGGEFNRKLTSFDAKNRNTLLNGITTQQIQEGTWFSSDFTTTTMLGLWALTGWHDKDQFNWTKSRAIDHAVSTQASNGSWNWTHPFAWWRSNMSLTGINVKSFVDYRKYLAAGPAPTAVPRYSVVEWPRGAAATGVWIALNEAPDGTLYVSRYNEARVDRLLANGTLQLVHSGLNVRDSLVTADGTLYMSAEQGVFRKSPAGVLTQLTNKQSAGIALGPDGMLYFAAYAERAVYKMPAAGGALTRLVPSAPLSTPHSVALDDDGSLVVADLSTNFIYRFLPDGTFTRLAEIFTAPFAAGSQPYKVQRWGDKWLVSGEGAAYIYNSEWQGERVLYEKAYGILATSEGEVIFGGNGRIKRLQIGADNVPARIASMDTSIERATNWLLLDSSLDANDNIQLATRMIGLGSALDHYKGTAKETTIRAKLEQVGASLRGRQRSNGGWTWFGISGTVDSLVTAMAGVGLDYLDPSPQSPEVRNAVTLLLSRQRADGTWISEAGVASPPLLTTTWVEIWLPTMLARLGGIDTDVSVTFPANVVMSNPDTAPTTTANADGSKTSVWRLTGVTADGRDINYDLALLDLAVNEARPVSTDAHLTFKNSFTGGSVNAPIDIPRVTASAFLDLGVTTDKTTYGAAAPVNISGQVTNTDGGLAGGSVNFEIFAPDGVLVATVGTMPFSNVAAGASANLGPVWNTGGTFARPGYYVQATLRDSLDRFVGTARSNFAIVANTGTLVSGRITTDKPVYLPSDTVRLVSRVVNLTQNEPLDSLTAMTTVVNPDGSVRFARSELIAQLAQGGLKDYGYALPLGFAQAGDYAASLSVRDAGGTVLASAAATFAVLSSAATGSGLTGTLTATPRPVPFGDPIAFSAVVNNLGNADLLALPAKIAIVDPVGQQPIAEFPATLDLPRLQSAPLSGVWTANARVGTTYVAVLSAVVGPGTITLAQVAFTIAPPATRVTGTLAAIPKQVPRGDPVTLSARVSNVGFGAIAGLPLSVTVANTATQQVVAQFTDSANIVLSGAYQRVFSWPATGAVGTSYTATLSATIDGSPRVLAQDGFSIIAPPVQLDVTLASLKQARILVLLSCTLGPDGQPRGQFAKDACVAQRSAFLSSYLTGLGITHRITTTEAEFTLAFRSGRYNTYWVTGGSLKLANTLTEEVREAVFRGDALILDDVHDERNHGLDPIAGFDLRGKLSPVNQTVSVIGPLFAEGTMATLDRPLKLVLTTGAAQAVFPDSANQPAIVTNAYGLGRGILFAYDLVGTLMAQHSSALDGLVSTAIGWVAPTPAAVSEARGYTVLRAKITNVGIAADLRATFTAPAGATVLGTAPAATPDASGRPVWSFTLDSGATKNLDVGLRLPATTGSFTASISIDLARNGLAQPFASFTTLSVESADTVAPRVASELAALNVSPNDKHDRDAAISNVQAAQASLAANDYEQAITQLITAAERLLKITSVDVAQYRAEVGRLLSEAQVGWFLAQP